MQHITALTALDVTEDIIIDSISVWYASDAYEYFKYKLNIKLFI